jgi:hypothetical protein
MMNGRRPRNHLNSPNPANRLAIVELAGRHHLLDQLARRRLVGAVLIPAVEVAHGGEDRPSPSRLAHRFAAEAVRRCPNN